MCGLVALPARADSLTSSQEVKAGYSAAIKQGLSHTPALRFPLQ